MRRWKLAPDHIALRKAGLEDAPILAVIGAATMLESFAGLLSGQSLVSAALNNHTPAFYSELLSRQSTHAWLAELPSGPDKSGAPVGYLILSAPDFPEDLLQARDRELKRIYLFSRFHKTGTGQRMMDLAVREAQQEGFSRLLLGVHQENHRAIAFYRRNGFSEIGRRSFRLGNSTFDDPVLARTL